MCTFNMCVCDEWGECKDVEQSQCYHVPVLYYKLILNVNMLCINGFLLK